MSPLRIQYIPQQKFAHEALGMFFCFFLYSNGVAQVYENSYILVLHG